MFETMMITFREGLEAFLIIAITMAYLIKTGGQQLIPTVKSAIWVSIIACAGLGIVFAKVGALTPLWEAILAIFAAILVISCTVHMLKMGKHMKQEITGAIDQAVANPGNGAKVALFGFVLLMIGREGLEACTMIASLAQQTDGKSLAMGGVLGLAIAALVAYLWKQLGHRVNLSLFFRVTAAFMVVFALQLLIVAFHEFTESREIAELGWFNTSYWHTVSEDWGPQGRIGAWISYSLVLVPLAFLCAGMLNKPNKPALKNTASA